ncbi:putative membrane protein [Prescottella equi]|uniref:SHOCT domain-containing protein n=1 Tax=Rhodococcus hoagii TaxID=43767 RepID=UPI0033934337
MMFWYANRMNGWGYALMIFAMMIAFGVLIVLAVIGDSSTRPDTQPPHPHADTPEQLLAQWLARGEIDDDRYHIHRVAAW